MNENMGVIKLVLKFFLSVFFFNYAPVFAIGPKVEYHFYIGEHEINAVVKIQPPGQNARSVAINVNKNLKTGEFSCVHYGRGRSGILMKVENVGYQEILEDLKRQINDLQEKNK